MTTDECIMYDQVVELGIATANEINLVRNVLDGSWKDILNRICYARTGCRSVGDYIQETIKMKQRIKSPLSFCAILTKKNFSKMHKNRARFGMIFVRYVY